MKDRGSDIEAARDGRPLLVEIKSQTPQIAARMRHYQPAARSGGAVQERRRVGSAPSAAGGLPGRRPSGTRLSYGTAANSGVELAPLRIPVPALYTLVESSL